jgi:hypothetical protein
MAKIITENFRVSNTGEFIDSFTEKNQIASEAIRRTVESYLIRQGVLYDEKEDVNDPLVQSTQLSETQRSTIETGVKTALDELRPENDYYVFASTTDPEEGRELSNTQFEKRDFLRRVIFGKKINDADIRYMFKKNPWVANRVYTAFDDQIDSENLNLYVTVGNGDGETSIKVFKCLSNNNGRPSTVEPTISLLNTDFETQSLADGYVWKYMFEVPVAEYLSFQTTTELPYVPDVNALATAKESISDIKIVKTPAFLFQDLNLGSCLTLSVSTDNARNLAEPIKTHRVEILVNDKTKIIKAGKGSYKNMYLRVVDPDNERLTIFDIVESEEVPGATDRMFIKIRTFIDSAGTHPNMNRLLGKEVFISPKIEITKSPGIHAIAYGVLDSAGTLSKINFINGGTEYKYATAKLLVPDSLAERETETELRVIPSPIGGHAANPILELFMSKAVVVTNFFATSEERIPESNGYTKIGLVKNPKFASAENVFPRVFDNRLYFSVGQDLTNVAIPGRVLEQEADGEKYYATIHEAIWDEDAGTTTIYSVDYIGDWSNKITDGKVNIKLTRDDSVVLSTLEDINNVRINPIIKTLSDGTPDPSGDYENNEYVAYTGDVLHFIDFDKIERAPNRKEKVKLVFDF